MSRSTDEGLRVSELKLCELVGVSQQYRQSLVQRGLLARAGRSGCTATDAVELATIERLGHHLRPGEVAVAWKDLRPQMRTIVPKGRLDVVFDSQLGSAAIVRDDATLRQAVVSGRPVLVVELGPRLQEVLDAFRRWSDAPRPPAARMRPVRRDEQAG
jgi:hypothetical protein